VKTTLTGMALAQELAAEVALSGARGEFLCWLARGRRRDSTIRWYARQFRSVVASAPDGWMRPEHIAEWIASAPAAATARGRRRAVGAFLRWYDPELAVRWLDGRTPAIPRPRGFDPLPLVLTTVQQRRLVDAARQHHPRDYAAVLALLDCGARVGELANVAVSDLAPGSVRLFGKTGARIVPLGPMAGNALLDAAGERWCFTGHGGAALTAKALANRVGRLFRAAGIPEGGAHALRHTFATMYIAGGGSVVRLQHILGHSSVSTTERYIHLAANDLATDHARLSPLASIGAGVQLRLVGEAV